MSPAPTFTQALLGGAGRRAYDLFGRGRRPPGGPWDEVEGAFMSRPVSRGSSLVDPVLVEAHLIRDFLVKAGIKLVAALALDFLLLRVWAPNLVNMHRDLALLAGVACLALALIITGWAGFQLFIDTRRFLDARRHLARANRLKLED